jgi:flagellar protein FliO/FliZ
MLFFAMWTAGVLTSTHAYAETTAPPAVSSGQLLQLVGGLLAVLVLIGVCAWASRLLPFVRNSRNSALKIVENFALGARERMLLVEVDGKRLLIGVSAAGMSCLHVLDSESSSGNQFAERLQQSMQDRTESTSINSACSGAGGAV